METSKIFLSLAEVTPEDEASVMAALRSGWVAPAGPQLAAFENAMCARTGLKYGVGLSCGTAAIHLGLRMAGVGRGDEVFVSTLTFAASANPVAYQGASPVFVDSDRATWNMDAALFAEAVADRKRKGRKLPKAAVVTHLYGQAADMDPIAQVCAENGIVLIEDTAEALGATYKGKHVGHHGIISAFSFNGNKIITTSGGGMLMTNDESLAQKARFLSTQARDPAPHYQHSQIGYNYRLSNILSALGLSQLSRLDAIIAHRRAVFDTYQKALGGIEGVEFMPEAPFGRATRWLSCLTIDPARARGKTSADVLKALAANGVEARPVWKPMHLQPVFADCEAVRGDVAQFLFENGVCLPSGGGVDAAAQARVIDIVRGCLR